MTQQQLASLIGRSVRALNDWENDRHHPRSAIGALEEVLGVSLDDAAGPEPPRQISAHRRRVLRGVIPDDAEYEIVIGYLEGRYGVTGLSEGGSAANGHG